VLRRLWEGFIVWRMRGGAGTKVDGEDAGASEGNVAWNSGKLVL